MNKESMRKRVFRWVSDYLNKRHTYLIKSLVYFSGDTSRLKAKPDYVRIASLALVAEEINNRKLEGAVAELGVFKGHFAREINSFFPGRRFYLFDTFEGFNEKDVVLEVKEGFSTGTQDFSNTNVESVLNIMPGRANCIVKKGYFPDTAANVDDKFVFVSLDADLYLPIYEGLHFFYNRLVPGGYIFVHDYNNSEYTGAKSAVQKFCSENRIAYIPLPDHSGTAVICK